MIGLSLVKSERFNSAQCDFWQDTKGNTWFTREQIGQALEYADPKEAVETIHRRNKDRLDKFSVTVKLTATDGKAYDTIVYSQKGLNEVCRFSRQPKADDFMDWAWDVIESIRKHGMYARDELLDNPDLMIEVMQTLKKEREEKKLLQMENAQQKQLIGELKPKADYTDIILRNKGLVTITQIAKDYGISGQAMNDLLYQNGVQYKQSDQWLLYSKHQSQGYTHSETVPIVHSDGSSGVVMHTKWTQKGRLFIYQLLKSTGVVPVIEKPRKQVN